MLRYTLLSATLAASSAFLATGCEGRCGEGTIDRDGVCVPAESNPDEANCGEGTVLGDDGKCVAELDPTICDEATTDPDTSTIPGVTICVGTGVASCDAPLPCPTASAGRVSVCGQLHDTQTGEPIRAAEPTFLPCDVEGAAQDGPCALAVAFYDAVAFAQNPSIDPTPAETFILDDCGRYAGGNIPAPQFGFIGVGIDDNPEVNDGIDYTLTGVAEEAGGADEVTRLKTFATRTSTVEDWEDDVDRDLVSATSGIYMGIHLYLDEPVAGVRVIDTNRPGATSNDDYYFNDVDPDSRTEADAEGPNGDNRTGPNGVSLLLNSALNDHSSQGGEPSGCQWPVGPAVSIPNAVFVSLREAHVTGEVDTPCPAQ